MQVHWQASIKGGMDALHLPEQLGEVKSKLCPLSCLICDFDNLVGFSQLLRQV